MKIRISSLDSIPSLVASALFAGIGSVTLLNAQPINVPNESFESPGAPMTSPYVIFDVDSWQKAARPDYYIAVEQATGILWNQTAAIFFGPGAYGNMDGIQAAYLFSFPQVSLFQDYETMDYNDAAPSHDFDASFEVGKSYSLTVGVFGKGFAGNMTEGSMLGLSLYYRDGVNMITVGTPTVVTYSASTFVNSGALNLIDFQVNTAEVQAGDPWAGQKIGIKIESIYGMGDGYWDVDNVRLVAVPEPTLAALLGTGSLILAAFRARRRA